MDLFNSAFVKISHMIIIQVPQCNEYGYMKYKSSSRLACHVTELVGSHLEVLLSLFNRNK